MDTSDLAHAEVMSLCTTVLAQQAEIRELQLADRRRQTVITEMLVADHKRQKQFTKALKLIKRLQTQMTEFERQQGPTKGLAQPNAPEEVGSSSYIMSWLVILYSLLSITGTKGVVKLTQWIKKMETVFRISNYSVENQIKFSTCTLLGNALTWWNSHVRTVGNDIAYAMTWTELKKKMTDKYCPRTEIKKLKVKLMFPEESDKIEKYVCGLPDMIHRSVVASKPKTMQKATEMAIEVMDKRIRTFADRQTESKRKFKDTSSNTQNQQQQQNKRQGCGI
ncbi:putative reverse transcriptase domain-containing protein, partial [Tanacetum coccineum]